MGKLITYTCLCHQAAYSDYDQKTVKLYSWEDNRRSGSSQTIITENSGCSTHRLGAYEWDIRVLHVLQECGLL